MIPMPIVVLMVHPDIMTMAKGLTCGYIPMGAVIVRQHITDHFETNLFVCGLTFSGNAFGCAAALATKGVYESENLVENNRVMPSRSSKEDSYLGIL